MIDLKHLREHPDLYREGARKKNIAADIGRILALDEQRRAALTEQESLRAEQRRLEKESGPMIGKLAGQLKKAEGPEKDRLQRELDELKARPAALKQSVEAAASRVAALDPELNALLLQVPLPPDDDVPVGKGSEDNVEVRRWNPPATNTGQPAFDPAVPFERQRGFAPRTHIELVRDLKLADFERGVKLAGTRSYVLTGAGMLLHSAVLRYAFDMMVHEHGFTPVSVPVLVREEAMVGTGFFPAGREQAYHVPDSGGTALGGTALGGTALQSGALGSAEHRGRSTALESGATRKNDLFLTGTGEVGLMGLYGGEILDEAALPLRLVTVSTCFRREAGAAGKDTAGLYRIHQFDKVEQVVICRADHAESRRWHQQMIGFVESLLQRLRLPYRLLQCCTGDLGPKNADMVDIECWMPGRGDAPPSSSSTPSRGAGVPPASPSPSASSSSPGTYGETHSASRLYDFQCRRLNMRYRAPKPGGGTDTIFCHSLNNTVAASPRILIPILEMYQNKDGTVTVPEVLRPYMGGVERIV